jgi:Zn-dependent protease with chaperone function
MSSSEPIRHATLTLAVFLSATACAPHPALASAQPRTASAGHTSHDDASPATPSIVPVPQPSARAVSFYTSGNRLWILRQLVAIAVPLFLLLGGISHRLRDWAFRVARWHPAALALFVVAFFAVSSLIELPLTVYAGFVRLHEYGLSTQPLQAWASDELKEFALSMGLLVPVVAAVYTLIRRTPRRWWIAAALFAVPVLLFLALVKPIWIDPLFDEFGPMRDKALEARILDLARRATIDADRVYEVAASKRTRAVNAYVTGLLGTKRIVLWDTLLDRLPPDEVLSVMGHEMGHYVLNHVVHGVVVASLLILAGLWIVSTLANGIIARWGHRLRLERPGDLAGLPLLVLLAQLAFLLLAPLGFAYSRHLEHEADRFSLELLRNNQAAARSFVALADANLGFPRPGWAYTLFRATHPSLGERIDFCNEYRPWETGQELVYRTLLRPGE